MKRITICIVWLAFTPLIFGQSSQPLRVTGHVTGQSYCYGDAQVFSVLMSIDLRITNVSKKSYFITSDMADVASRVATSLEEAQRGNYIVRWSPTRYPTDADESHPIFSLPAGQSKVLHIKDGVVARFKASPSIGGTVPPGKYVLQLDLRSEDGFAESAPDDEAKGRVVFLKTEPISFEIPPNVTNPLECKK